MIKITIETMLKMKRSRK